MDSDYTSFAEQFSSEWTEISTEQYEFDRVEKAIAELAHVEKRDFIDYFDAVFFSNQTSRVDIEILSSNVALEQEKYRVMISDDEIFGERILVNTTISEFKLQAQFYDEPHQIILMGQDPVVESTPAIVWYFVFFAFMLMLSKMFWKPKKSESRIQQEEKLLQI